MKYLLLAAILIVGGFVAYNIFNQPTPPTLLPLLAHFEANGVTVEGRSQSPEEEAFIERFKTEVSQVKEELNLEADNYPLVNTVTVDLDGVKTKIQVFETKESAFEEYQKELTTQTNREARAERTRSQYNKTDVYLNGHYVMYIRHWEAFLVDGKLSAKPELLEVDPDTQTRIVSIFNNFSYDQ